jgi:hypothetical protein
LFHVTFLKMSAPIFNIELMAGICSGSSGRGRLP